MCTGKPHAESTCPARTVRLGGHSRCQLATVQVRTYTRTQVTERAGGRKAHSRPGNQRIAVVKPDAPQCGCEAAGVAAGEGSRLRRLRQR